MIRFYRAINPAVCLLGILASFTGAQAEERTPTFPIA